MNNKTQQRPIKSQPADVFEEVRGADGRLLFRYNPIGNVIEIKPKGGRIELVYLSSRFKVATVDQAGK